MPVPNTAKISQLTQYIYDLITTNKVSLGLIDVYFGDQLLIPHTPSLVVDPGQRTRELEHTGFAGTNEFQIFLIIYHGKMQDNQITKKESIVFAEGVEALLHSDKQMGGNLIVGYVQSIDPGYAVRSGELWRASRISYYGKSRTIF